jgi:transcriptional regulator with PAS, ATPase and Fis domain
MKLAEIEKRAILEAVDKAKGDKLLAAERLGIGKTTLYRKLKEYGRGGRKKSRGKKK